jgi:hypothetical protein
MLFCGFALLDSASLVGVLLYVANCSGGPPHPVKVVLVGIGATFIMGVAINLIGFFRGKLGATHLAFAQIIQPACFSTIGLLFSLRGVESLPAIAAMLFVIIAMVCTIHLGVVSRLHRHGTHSADVVFKLFYNRVFRAA